MSVEYLESPIIVNDLKDAKSVFVKEKFYDAKTLKKIGEKLTEYKLTKQGCIPQCIYDRNSNGNGINHKDFERKAFIFLINACSYKRMVKEDLIRISDVWKSTYTKNQMNKEEMFSETELNFKKYLVEREKMQELKAQNMMNIIHRFHDLYDDDLLSKGDEDYVIIQTFGEKWFKDTCFSTKTKYRRAFREYKDFLKREEIYD